MTNRSPQPTVPQQMTPWASRQSVLRPHASGECSQATSCVRLKRLASPSLRNFSANSEVKTSYRRGAENRGGKRSFAVYGFLPKIRINQSDVRAAKKTA